MTGRNEREARWLRGSRISFCLSSSNSLGWQDLGLDVSRWSSWMASACSSLRQGFGSQPETELRPLQWGCWLHAGGLSPQGPWPVARPRPASCVEMSSFACTALSQDGFQWRGLWVVGIVCFEVALPAFLTSKEPFSARVIRKVSLTW